ncbi:hypothetical protein D3C87_1574100 [compost metagenome]
MIPGDNHFAILIELKTRGIQIKSRRCYHGCKALFKLLLSIREEFVHLVVFMFMILVHAGEIRTKAID